ncbi:MAG TPA: hypothetical protein VGQ58_05670 [Candidatus Limnocylindrales bacterium]|nr:hypothetical protein [Candidatus Limnocylindrales bacterium]
MPVAKAAPEGDHMMSEATAGAATTGEGGRAPASSDSSAGARRPNKFMADLTKAMQTAAETAREEAMGRLQAEAKASVEQIHERSAAEATNLRRQADDDVASIREWSKAEIARIREETDQRIAERKASLEQEIEQHAAHIERRIERVQGRVSAFEEDMAAFFARLLAEDDPTAFAAMAQNLPEPEPFDAEDVLLSSPATRHEPAARYRKVADEVPHAEPRDSASAMAAIQAAAEAAEVGQPRVGVASSFEADSPVQAVAMEAQAEAEALTQAEAQVEAQVEAEDPRLAALAGSADFAAAEAEAAVAAGASDMTEEIPTIADDALAARLAGLVPGSGEDGAPAASGEASTTQIVVTGLISVASIASFKRHLGRVPGVQSVGVSSGPEGEFIFAVHHGPEVVLREAVPGLPGFRARVTGGKDSTVEVAAHDPESEA